MRGHTQLISGLDLDVDLRACKKNKPNNCERALTGLVRFLNCSVKIIRDARKLLSAATKANDRATSSRLHVRNVSQIMKVKEHCAFENEAQVNILALKEKKKEEEAAFGTKREGQCLAREVRGLK